jgi:hypothetical protein
MQQEQLLMGEWLDSLMYENWGGKALSLVLDGSPFMFATDGHGLTLVAGAGEKPASDHYLGMVKSLLALDTGPGRRSFTLPLSELRAWLPSDTANPPCPACKGGELKEFKCGTCRGEGVKECGHCGNETECHECGGAKKSLQCYECEGDGTVAAKRSPAPLVPGVIVDRRVAQRFLGPLLCGEQVKVSVGGALEAAFFYGDGWTVVVMPFRYDESDVTDNLGATAIELAEGNVPLGPSLREAVSG